MLHQSPAVLTNRCCKLVTEQFLILFGSASRRQQTPFCELVVLRRSCDYQYPNSRIIENCLPLRSSHNVSMLQAAGLFSLSFKRSRPQSIPAVCFSQPRTSPPISVGMELCRKIVLLSPRPPRLASVDSKHLFWRFASHHDTGEIKTTT
jgi:hypothetical protein